MNTKKSLAKVFGPVLLLTATLALPIDTAQAAPGNGRGHAQAEQHNKNKKDKQKHEQQRTEVRRQQRQPQHRQQVVVHQKSERPKVQKKVKKVVVQQPVVVQRRQVVRTQDVRRQEALRLQAQRQQAYQRQQALERQRALDRQRALARQRQAPVYRDGRRYDNRRYDDRYYATPRRGGGGGADPNVFHIDGYLDDGGECLFMRDHEGRTWAMVGNTYGLQPGEHVRLYGRPVDGSACGYRGAAFDIYEVRTVWADNNHKRTYYDHLYDGPFDQNRAYEDDRYYNDQYEEDRDADSWWDRLFGG